MIEPIDAYIRKLESLLEDAEWIGCDSPFLRVALELAYDARERGETYYVYF